VKPDPTSEVPDNDSSFGVAAIALFTTEGQGFFSQGDSPAETSVT